MLLLRNKKNISSLKGLIDSYDRLYEGFLGENSTELEAEFMLNLIESKQGDTLLDVSSGKGELVFMAKERGLSPVGIEISNKALEIAKDRYPSCEYINANAEDLPFEDNSFDFVTNLGSLEHYLNPEKACGEMVRVLKPEGKAIILLPNSHDILTFRSILNQGKGPDDCQDYERFASRQEWHNFLETYGFKVLTTHKFDRKFPKKPFGWFQFFYNMFIKYIPLNLSRVFVFICEKKKGKIA